MSLQLRGRVLEVTSETVQGPTGSFVSTTVHVLAGVHVEAVRTGREFPMSDLPKKDDEVALNVAVAAYSGRNGAGYRLTALSRVYATPAAVKAS